MKKIMTSIVAFTLLFSCSIAQEKKGTDEKNQVQQIQINHS